MKETTPLTGISFLTNVKGDKTAVLIDLRKHSQLWEDIYDTILFRKRAHEPRESLQTVKKRLVRHGKLRG